MSQRYRGKWSFFYWGNSHYCSVLLQACSASLRVTLQSCSWLGAREPDWESLIQKACTTWGCPLTKPSFRSRLNAYWSSRSWLSRSTKSSAVFPGKTLMKTGLRHFSSCANKHCFSICNWEKTALWSTDEGCPSIHLSVHPSILYCLTPHRVCEGTGGALAYPTH